MESYESVALENPQLKPEVCFRYVEDTFTIWPHGRDTVDSFLGHLNSQHPDIKFTMEIEKNGAIPSLNASITRKTLRSSRSVTITKTHAH
ncbi:hypothetical protein Trydic_g19118 [Trypoxylus dichotomus]